MQLCYLSQSVLWTTSVVYVVRVNHENAIALHATVAILDSLNLKSNICAHSRAHGRLRRSSRANCIRQILIQLHIRHGLAGSLVTEEELRINDCYKISEILFSKQYTLKKRYYINSVILIKNNFINSIIILMKQITF